jgi:hypothetical protein
MAVWVDVRMWSELVRGRSYRIVWVLVLMRLMFVLGLVLVLQLVLVLLLIAAQRSVERAGRGVGVWEGGI